MCFAPQRRALFRHLNFQKWSEAGVFCTFWLRNVLRTTTTCTFSTSQLPKVVRSWCVLYILTSKRQRRALFRHRNFQKWSEPGVLCTFSLGNVLRATTACNFDQFCISHLARWLRTRRFSEPTFRPSGATNHWKNIVFRDFPTFSRTFIFFLLLFSDLLSSTLPFSDSSHLCFSSVHIVGSLTSKLPSNISHFIPTISALSPLFSLHTPMMLIHASSVQKPLSFNSTGWLGIPKADANPAFTTPCPGWCTDSNRPDVQMLEPRASLRRTRITQVGEIQCEIWCNMPVLRFDLLLFTCFSYFQTRRKQTPADWILLFRSLIATFVAMFWSP